jgi:hypothetical protein
MTIVPRPLVDLITRYRMQRLRRRLHASGDGWAAQRATFTALLRQFGDTEFGRQHGLAAGMSYDSFRRDLPLRTSADFRGFTERMAGGARDVLWPGACRQFVYTAGTVDGTPKMLPVTPAMALHFRTALSDAWLLHVARRDRTSLFHGRHVQIGASTALQSAHGAKAGYLEGIMRANLSEWARENLCAPPAAIAALPEGPQKTAATVQACTERDVRLVCGTPGALIALLEAAQTHGVAWRELECCVHTGALLGSLERPLAARLGPQVSLHEIYAAAEGVFAAQDAESERGLRLLTDAGIFFEFLPLREATGDLTAHAAACVPLADVRPNLDYALVVTTPAGLCRCLVGDAVRFVSTQPPRLLVTGRTPTRLNCFGEQVAERDVTDALLEVCGRSEWDIVHFHVAPYLTRTVPRPHGHHEWWVELRPGTVRTPTGPVLASELDIELTRRNRDYSARRRQGAMDAPVVRLVMPGMFERWADLHPTFGGPGKTARCRNDRVMADQLAAIARFHPENTAPY